MRVLIIGLGGISQQFRNWPERTLGQALVRAGHTVDAITYHQPKQSHLGLTARHEIIDGINVYRVKPEFFPAQQLMAQLRHLPRPDIIHLMHPRNVLGYQVLRYARSQKIPTAWTWLGPFHDHWLVNDRERPYEERPHPENLISNQRQLLRRILMSLAKPAHPKAMARSIQDHLRNYAIHAPLYQADGFIPCSKHEEEVLAELGLADRPSQVVPLWLDMEFMNSVVPEIELPFTRPIIPYIGQLTIRKCYDLVVEAMPRIVEHFPQASFVFVTHNPEQRANLQAMAAERGVAQHVHFLGTISEEQKLALLRKSDLLPFPSRYEGFGLPVLEAMATRLPVISTNIPVINELIHDGENGLLVPYNDSTALANAMLSILKQPELRQKLIEGGTQAMQNQFQPEQLCNQVIRMYHSLIGRLGQ